MKTVLKIMSALISVLFLCAAAGCAGNTENNKQNPPPQAEQPDPDEGYTKRSLTLVKGDTYDFSATDLTLEKTDGAALTAQGSVINAAKSGTAKAYVKSAGGEKFVYKVTVCRSAEESGGKFAFDKGSVKGKKVIVFGDSITDGNMGNQTNYSDTYFSLLCKYFEADVDPEDLLNVNFARGGTTLTYGLRKGAGISGVERADKESVFYDGGTIARDPYGNVTEADYCFIFYGTNDFTENVYKDNSVKTNFNDSPGSADEARTIKGGAYYMINRLYTLNPELKIIVLPPLYRRAEGHLKYVEGNNDDVINSVTGEKLSEYGEVLSEVCSALGAKYINWYPVFGYDNFGNSSEFTSDGLHPNKQGHKKMFDFILNELENRG